MTPTFNLSVSESQRPSVSNHENLSVQSEQEDFIMMDHKKHESYNDYSFYPKTSSSEDRLTQITNSAGVK